MLLRTVLVFCFVLIVHTAHSQDWVLASSTSLGVTTKLAWTHKGLFMYDGDTVRRSMDEGATWSDVPHGLPGNVYAVIESDGSIYAVGPAPGATVGIFRSASGGGAFTRVGDITLPSGTITQLAVNGGELIAVSNRSSVFVSTDAGLTWAERTVPASVSNMVDFAADGDHWVVAGVGGAARSTDGGITWTALSDLPGFGGKPNHLGFSGSTVVASGTMGTWRLTDNGWATISGLPVAATLPATVQDLTSSGGTAFAVAVPFGGSVGTYYLTPDATEWRQLGTTTYPAGHGAARNMMTVSPTKVFMHYVGVGHPLRGTFTITNPAGGTSSVAENVSNHVPVYPTPSHTSCTISLPENIDGERIDVDIHDIGLGRVRASAHASRDAITIDVSGLPSGIYTVLCHQEGKIVLSTRMIVVH